MDALQKYDQYVKWEREHKARITEVLSNEFKREYKPDIDFIWETSDFSGLIGLPLFALMIALSIKYTFTIGLLVSAAVGYYLMYFTKHVILLCLKHRFEMHDYYQILQKYVADYWQEKFDKAKTEEERIEINELYSSFRSSIVSTHTRFEYWK